jgi:UDP-N-acetyl-D-glucosamine dehydrogenase
VNGAKIVLLGVAYKRDVDDVRESPALDVLKLLEADGAEVTYHDPYVPEWKGDGVIRESQALTDELLNGADAVVILTDHTDFDYAWILEQAQVLVDTRHALVAAGAVPEDGVGSWIVKG